MHNEFMRLELPKIKIVLRAALVVTIMTMLVYYFPNLTFPNSIVFLCALLATKYLTNFMWLGAIGAFIFAGGSGGDPSDTNILVYILAKSLVCWFMAICMVRQDLYDSENK